MDFMERFSFLSQLEPKIRTPGKIYMRALASYGGTIESS
jgi:hypothetical protein